jgi:hypothetical protein
MRISEKRLKSYRLRSNEIRAAAHNVGDGVNRATLCLVARDYELLADNLEAKVNRRRQQKLLQHLEGGGAHMQYRCFLLDLQSKIVAVEIIDAQTDADAVARAEAIFHAKRASGFEVWDRGRRVERVLKEGAELIRRWRMKAEEIRTAADGFGDGSARQALRNSAETYEALANAAEARAERRKDRETETG